MEQIVSKESRKATAMTEDAVHFPSTSSYSVKRMYDDLLNFSVKNLKLGGRLVCWIPVIKEDYSENLLPQHSALELIANSEQKLIGDASRRLLTYEKIKESGELVEISVPEENDFRSKYLSQGEGASKQEKRMAAHQHNVLEAAKRGKTLESRTEFKKSFNKKMLLERDKEDQ
jgi:tRNA (guanine10-N2)-methyltransferase